MFYIFDQYADANPMVMCVGHGIIPVLRRTLTLLESLVCELGLQEPVTDPLLEHFQQPLSHMIYYDLTCILQFVQCLCYPRIQKLT